MKLSIQAHLDYQFNEPTDILLQLEAAHIPEQSVETHDLALSHSEYFARVPSHDMIGERIWLNLDYAQNGLGSASCGPGVLPAYRLSAVPATFTVVFRPVG